MHCIRNARTKSVRNPLTFCINNYFFVHSGIWLKKQCNLNVYGFCRFELIKLNNYKGLALNIVQMFSKQVLILILITFLILLTSLRVLIEFWFLFYSIIFKILICVMSLDSTCFSCDKGCWYHTLWFKARKYTYIHEVISL